MSLAVAAQRVIDVVGPRQIRSIERAKLEWSQAISYRAAKYCSVQDINIILLWSCFSYLDERRVGIIFELHKLLKLIIQETFCTKLLHQFLNPGIQVVHTWTPAPQLQVSRPLRFVSISETKF